MKKRDQAKARRALATWAKQQQEARRERDSRTGLTNRAELVARLLAKRAGASPADQVDAAICDDHAHAIVDALAELLVRYRAEKLIQDEVRAAGRERRGRPADWPERNLAHGVVETLTAHGIKATDYFNAYHEAASTAALVMLEVLDAAGRPVTKPRNAIKRGRARARAIKAIEK